LKKKKKVSANEPLTLNINNEFGYKVNNVERNEYEKCRVDFECETKINAACISDEWAQVKYCVGIH